MPEQSSLDLDRWYPQQQQAQTVERLLQRVGFTRVRAECLVRLWIYLLIKQAQQRKLKPPLGELVLPEIAISCTLREAAALFYHDKEQGSDRAAGLMLDKLVALGAIKKSFDGNTTWIEIQPIPELLEQSTSPETPVLKLDDFDPRCDAVPVANLLATNYNWMNHNSNSVPHRIARLLRSWANQYPLGMRVLRRHDNLNPVGFYLLYPTASESDANFFNAPHKALHLSTMTEDDPFKMAAVGDTNCVSVFIRSWMIEPEYVQKYQNLFIQDAQQTLVKMRQDFPNLCDLHTLIIHPQYEKLGLMLGFQRSHRNLKASIYWMYLALDRFLALELPSTHSEKL